MYQRRDFLKMTATGFALTAITGKLLGCNSSSMLGSSGNIKEFGLQLYTLRDVMPNNPKGVLKQVAEMGYKQIESYPHNKLGIFWGMTNIEFKKYMDSLGMQIVASHCGMKDFEKTASDAAEIGMKYLLFGSLDNEKGMDRGDYKKAAELLNEKGEICKRNGIKFAYHNHDQTFTQRTGGFIPQEVLLENTDPALVDFEMDIYWTVTGGQNPETWLRKYPNRFKLCHIKDRKKGAPLSEREVSVNLGTGSIDFKKILKVAKENGMKYYIVEQEKYEGTTPLSAAKADAEYLKKLKI
ncbi:MAG TPA: sugar phosphate isomerase/epimerase [Chitinophagaceae bacterium]|nr:sugar phosphate isomerase/epimerase [Chitinophagaceae bacterium]